MARPGDTATSSLEPGWRAHVAGPRIPVQVESQRLDQLSQNLNLQNIDWLKIDVEGHEVAVLEGGSSTLAKTQRLIIEVSQGHEKAILDLTRRAGLRLAAVEPQIGTHVSSWLMVRAG